MPLAKPLLFENDKNSQDQQKTSIASILTSNDGGAVHYDQSLHNYVKLYITVISVVEI